MSSIKKSITSSKPRSIRKDLYITFIEWCEKTSAHGIQSLIKTKSKFIRVLWILCLMTSITCFVYVTVKSCIDYYEYKTITSIKHHDECQPTFPAITICNRNPFIEFEVGQYVKNNPTGLKEYASCIQSSNDWLDCFNDDTIADAYNYIHSIFKRITVNDKALYLNRSNYTHNIVNMIINCNYYSEKCNADNFTEHWMTPFGNCYTFNDGKNKRMLKAVKNGKNLGLDLTFSLKPPDSRLDYVTGLHVLISNQSKSEFSISNRFFVPTGFRTTIGISRRFTKKLPAPYSNCIKDLKPHSKHTKKIFGYFHSLNITEYSQDFCSLLCYQDKLIEKCNCISRLTAVIKNMPYCASKQELACENSIYNEFFSQQTSERQLCDAVCLEECDRMEYDFDKTMVPALGYMRFLNSYYNLKPKLNESYAQKSLLLLTIYYDKFSYTVAEEHAQITFEELLGNIGGQLGLFIGVSLINFLEVLELFANVSILLVQHFKSRVNKKKCDLI